jgi:NTP pyrophosphatase (non-canonical NTP hydrolase)
MNEEGREPLRVSDFEESARLTDEMEPEPDTAFLGLFGEIGSLVSALKKRRRDKDAYFGYERAVLEEVGDVLWYASAFARRGGTSLAEAASRAIGDRTASNRVTLGEISPNCEQPVSEAVVETALLDLAGEAISRSGSKTAYTRITPMRFGGISLSCCVRLGELQQHSASPWISPVIATSTRPRAAGERGQTGLRCLTKAWTSTSSYHGS